MNNSEYINKYKDLVSSAVCEKNGVDYNDEVARADLAYRLLTGNDCKREIKVNTDAQFAIDRNGVFFDPNIGKAYGDIKDLFNDPVSLAFRMLQREYVDIPVTPVLDEIDHPETITFQLNNLYWIARLFTSMHNRMLREDNVPMLWKLMDHYYQLDTQLECKVSVAGKVPYFVFAHGVCTGEPYDTSTKEKLNKTFARNMSSVSAILCDDCEGEWISAQMAVESYIRKFSLPYIIVK